MHIRIHLFARHLQKEQHHGKHCRRDDVAISISQRVLYQAVADQTAIHKNKDGIAIELLYFRLRDESMHADSTGHGGLDFWIAAPGRQLRDTDAGQVDLRREWHQLIERLPAKDLIYPFGVRL